MSRSRSLWIAVSCFTAALATLRLCAHDAHPDSSRNPFASHPLERSARFTFEGDVEERLEAGPYVYQRIAGRWVASLALTTPARARAVRVTALGQAQNFESPRLQRRFDELLFGIVRSSQ